MNTLDIAISLNLEPKKNGGKHGGEFISPCPLCKAGTDRFHVWPFSGPSGYWWCRKCGKGGDAVQLLKEAKGMTYKEACDYLGIEARKGRKRTVAPAPPMAHAPDFVPREISDPGDLWQARAAAFADYAHEDLLKNPGQLAWLAERGITAESVKRFKLGWNPKKLWRKRSAWGIPDKKIKTQDGTEKVLILFGLPLGLVIPYFTTPLPEGEKSPAVIRLRVRRPEPGLDDRYHIIPGSATPPMMIPQPPGRAPVWTIVESELDAILVAQDAGDITGTAALGSVAVKPDTALAAALKPAASILVSLDADEAGQKAWPWWRARFPQADRWPVPAGKDPGDYRKAGGDIRAWIIAGLPPGLRPVETKPQKAETKEAEPETQPAPAASQDPQIDKKADSPIPADIPSPSMGEGGGEGDPLFGWTSHERKCQGCGAPMTVYTPKGQRPYTGPCFKCLPQPKPHKEKKRWQPMA